MVKIYGRQLFWKMFHRKTVFIRSVVHAYLDLRCCIKIITIRKTLLIYHRLIQTSYILWYFVVNFCYIKLFHYSLVKSHSKRNSLYIHNLIFKNSEEEIFMRYEKPEWNCSIPKHLLPWGENQIFGKTQNIERFNE